MKLDRRQLLKLAGALGAVHMTPPIFAKTQQSEPHFLVTISLKGGWDVTLGTDPWTESAPPDERDMFIEYRQGDLKRSQDLWFGPALDPLFPHAKDMSVINGIVVSAIDQGHDAAEVYMETGDPSGRSANLSLESAHLTKEGPYGIITSSTFLRSGRRELIATPVEAVISQINGLDLSEFIESLLSEGGSETDLIKAKERIVSSQTQTKILNEILKQNLSAGIELSAQHVIAASFISGAAFQASLSVPNTFLDSHADHPGNHLNVLKSGFDHIHQIFTYFKSIEWQQSGQSLFDKTLFVITSEFSRTPYLNSARGKDHNPMTNSVILAGSGVKGGSTLGGSRLITAAQSKSNFAYHMGRPIDKSSGLIAGGKENSMFIFPEMVLMTIGQILGWQMSDLQSIPKDTPHLPWVLK